MEIERKQPIVGDLFFRLVYDSYLRSGKIDWPALPKPAQPAECHDEKRVAA